MWWRKRTDPIEPNGVLRVLRCSFCNKGQHDVKKLIAGAKSVFICSECVEVCNEPEGLWPDPETADTVMPWPETIPCALSPARLNLR